MEATAPPAWVGFVCCGVWHLLVLSVGFALGVRARADQVEVISQRGREPEDE